MDTSGSWELPAGPPIAGEGPEPTGGSLPPPPLRATAPTAVPPVPPNVASVDPYESPLALASLARLGLSACAVVAAGAVVSDVAQYVFADAHLGDPTNARATDRLATSDLWQGLLAALAVLVLVPTAAVFLMWLSRVYRNLPALGARHVQVSPGWVVGAWFVPVINLLWPKLIVDEAWRSSAPAAEDDPTDGRAEPIPVALHVWWACSVGTVVLWLVSTWLTGSVLFGITDDPGSLRWGYAIEIVASALALAAAVLAAGLVRDLTSRQRERAARVASVAASGSGAVQPRVDQRPVPGYPEPPPVPPVAPAQPAAPPWSTPGSAPSGPATSAPVPFTTHPRT